MPGPRGAAGSDETPKEGGTTDGAFAAAGARGATCFIWTVLPIPRSLFGTTSSRTDSENSRWLEASGETCGAERGEAPGSDAAAGGTALAFGWMVDANGSMGALAAATGAPQALQNFCAPSSSAAHVEHVITPAVSHDSRAVGTARGSSLRYAAVTGR